MKRFVDLNKGDEFFYISYDLVCGISIYISIIEKIFKESDYIEIQTAKIKDSRFHDIKHKSNFNLESIDIEQDDRDSYHVTPSMFNTCFTLYPYPRHHDPLIDVYIATSIEAVLLALVKFEILDL